MRILVTGAGGQTGSELVRRARSRSLTVIGLSREELDITSAELVNSAITDHHPDLVVNTAAFTAVDRAEREKECAFAVNRDGPTHLARACFDNKVPLLHLSTDYVFDGRGTAPLRENDETRPCNVYGESKLAGEQMVRELQREHLIIRTSWVFGATGSNFVKTVLRLAGERDQLQIVDDQVGCPTWTGHIADLIIELTIKLEQHGTLPWGTYHYCGAPETTWDGFAEEMVSRGREIGSLTTSSIRAIATGDRPTKASRPVYGVLSCDKIDRYLNVKRPRWQDALGEVLEEIADA